MKSPSDRVHQETDLKHGRLYAIDDSKRLPYIANAYIVYKTKEKEVA